MCLIGLYFICCFFFLELSKFAASMVIVTVSGADVETVVLSVRMQLLNERSLMGERLQPSETVLHVSFSECVSALKSKRASR